MKKILLLLFFAPLFAKSQNLDTVIVRNLQMQAQDWGWLIGNSANAISTDSAGAREFRRIRDRIRTANPATKTTNVTIDSIPGRVAFYFYNITKSAPAGEIAARYAAITGAINGKANMVFFTNTVDAQKSAEFDRKYGVGKFMVMDQ